MSLVIAPAVDVPGCDGVAPAEARIKDDDVIPPAVAGR